MPTARVCTECGASLAGRSTNAYTCCDAHRKQRQRRRAEEKAERANRAATGSELVKRRVKDVAHDVLKEELRPIVREAITEDAIRALDKMIGLTGKAVEVLERDMEGDDFVLASRAANTVIKYTVGHPAVIRPQEEASHGMQVIFQLPRPDQPTPMPIEGEAEDDEDTGQRRCDICHELKPVSDFEGDSDRCTACFTQWREQVLHSIA